MVKRCLPQTHIEDLLRGAHRRLLLLTVQCTCETFQHTFDFSSTKKDFSMHFANLDSKETSKVNYKILSVEGSTLYTDMEGEDRKDKNGNLVSWYLVVNDQNSYCWRRSDWGLNSCTNPITRCLKSRRP